MAIITPDILPGEKGYIPKKIRTAKKKEREKKEKKKQQQKERTIGKIKTGRLRIGRPTVSPRKEEKYPVWRYSKKVGEIKVTNKEKENEEITLTYNRLGGIGNYKHLIEDADFQMEWAIKEQELLMTQKECYLCKKKLSKSAQPNLYHYNLFTKRAKLLEEAQGVPKEVIEGKITLEEGWEKFNNIIEEGNRYYMSLKETALICANCAKQKGIKK